ncbi:FAD-dependent monooxygenase [Streptomyces sp. NPDC052309]|uniref:FAD-dependent oxidoreductase n=1 Tax=Streptomyces sp. NPDC052309 TaxID=3155421 RepID=UPI0034283FC6
MGLGLTSVVGTAARGAAPAPFNAFELKSVYPPTLGARARALSAHLVDGGSPCRPVRPAVRAGGLTVTPLGHLASTVPVSSSTRVIRGVRQRAVAAGPGHELAPCRRLVPLPALHRPVAGRRQGQVITLVGVGVHAASLGRWCRCAGAGPPRQHPHGVREDPHRCQTGKVASQPGRSRHRSTPTPPDQDDGSGCAAEHGWRLALAGNAAHVPTPMTGSGFAASMDDADAIAEAVASGLRHGTPLPRALAAYERKCLARARSLVQSGQQFSRSFAGSSYRGPQDRPSGDRRTAPPAR